MQLINLYAIITIESEVIIVKTWMRFDISKVTLKCPREPWKITGMEIRYSVFNNGERILVPIMYCHNEYGLENCMICKKSLFEHIKSFFVCVR